ncbi:hypothetical protein SLEP1_g22527 [Rubroshorea leprosula]|uniref:Uncharacterized protein n=1 Tax=Rubroshorea leprosula TaxID=152421 RepID=A0AAV5JJY6_9ROSI|nr:hypothetical protein SLEP1_g22527 [Rubroshorea leprosula]
MEETSISFPYRICFRDCTCWHATSLIKGTPYLLTEFIS